jgi:hypothetical protein
LRCLRWSGARHANQTPEPTLWKGSARSDQFNDWAQRQRWIKDGAILFVGIVDLKRARSAGDRLLISLSEC